MFDILADRTYRHPFLAQIVALLGTAGVLRIDSPTLDSEGRREAEACPTTST